MSDISNRPVGAQRHFDRQELLNRIDHDEELLAQILQSFVAGMPGMLIGLQECLHEGSYDEAKKEAHKIKGTCLNVTADAMAELAGLVECELKAGKYAAASNTGTSLRNEFAHVMTIIGDCSAAFGKEGARS
ncbi:MAG: hypothetical protein GF398_10205 [Chitinivibrionales bacterium]|nr:hypothetical protein [Chitinivibrionales bacterium]